MKKLIIINGPPGSGKTTVTTALREHIDMVIIEKDAIKEFYFEYVGYGDRKWSIALGKAAIDSMLSLVDQIFHIQDQILIETAFYASIMKEDIAKLRRSHDIEVLEIYCQLDEGVRSKRFFERANSTRHPGHADILSPNEATENLDRYAPIAVGDIVYIDTENDIDVARLAETIKQFCRRG